MITIKKAAHYRSFYNVAKKIKDPAARLAFYDALDAYRFDGVQPENLPLEADIAFTALEPFLEADIKRKTARVDGGNNDGRPESGITAEELREAYADCGSWDDVAAEYGISRRTVYNILRRREADSAAEDVQGSAQPDVNVNVQRVQNVQKVCNVQKHNDNDNVNGKANVNVKVHNAVHKNVQQTKTVAQTVPQKMHTRFCKPTVEDVRAYCEERANKIDAQRFCDYYEAKGWLVGKSPMKDWRAAVRTWEKNNRPPPVTACGSNWQEDKLIF